ncbi:hypothetical protein [Picosynechococcus sp. PCC 11901]
MMQNLAAALKLSRKIMAVLIFCWRSPQCMYGALPSFTNSFMRQAEMG